MIATPLLAIAPIKPGWWRPALFDAGRSRRRWPIVAPILMAGLLVLNLVATDWAAYGGPVLAASIVLLLVGFTEEITLRALLLVALRSKFAEVWVWLSSTLAFSLMHFGSVIFGQGVAVTSAQAVFAFLAGTIFHIARRATGDPGLAMLLHGFWDFSALPSITGTPLRPRISSRSRSWVSACSRWPPSGSRSSRCHSGGSSRREEGDDSLVARQAHFCL